MAELVLTREQINTLAKISKDHSVMYLSKAGPFLCARVYVQSASSSGYTYWYYNKKGEKVDA